MNVVVPFDEVLRTELSDADARRPLCVRVAIARGEDLTTHAQYWHDVNEREQYGGCGRCAYLAAAAHRLVTERLPPRDVPPASPTLGAHPDLEVPF
jgi:hypothetical protein